jgi:WD40 repeat protein
MLMKIVALFLTPALVACAQNPQADEHVRAPGQDEVMEAFGGGLHQKVALSSDGKWILAPDSLSTHVHLWELETGKKEVDFKGSVAGAYAVAFSPDGRWILSGGGRDESLPGQAEDDSVRLWDRTTGKEIRRFEGHTSKVMTVQFSPDGKRILTGGCDSAARVWDVETGKQLHSFSNYFFGTPETSLSFSPSGDHILMTTRPGAEILDARTGAVLCKIQVEEPGWHGFNSAEYSPDGRLVVTASADKTARLWDVQTGLEIRTLKGHATFVLDASFSLDATQVVTASQDETMRIWNATTGAELKRLTNPGSVRFARFSDDGKRVVAQWRSDANYKVVEGVSLWDIAVGREIKRLTGGVLNAIALDRRRILVEDDRGGQLWDVSSGEVLRSYPQKR